MLLDADLSQLVLVDYQEKLMPSIYENTLVLRNAQILARLGSLFSVPTWGTEQVPEKLGGNDALIHDLCKQTLVKHSFSGVHEGLLDFLRPPARALSGNARSLPKHLQKKKEEQKEERDQIVLAGCEAHVCLLQTALELIEEDFIVWVVTDACSSRTERNRDAAFDRLASAGAELVSTEMVAFEWCRSAENSVFKEVLALVK